MTERTMPEGLTDERSLLDGWLDYYRATLLAKCDGLTGQQLITRSCEPSPMSLIGLIRHMTEMERVYGHRLADWDISWLYCSDENEAGDFEAATAAGTMADLNTFRAHCARTAQIMAAHRLDDTFGQANSYTLRWFYLYLIKEYARHLGHADLLRERLDGVTGELGSAGTQGHPAGLVPAAAGASVRVWGGSTICRPAVVSSLSPRPRRPKPLGVTGNWQVIPSPVHARGGISMPLYMYQASYTAKAMAAQLQDPQDPVEAIRPALEELGATIMVAAFPFGEYDLLVVYEAPDDMTAASVAMAVAAEGEVKSAKTTRLLSGQEWLESLRKRRIVSTRKAR